MSEEHDEDTLSASAATELEELLPDGHEYLILETDVTPDNGLTILLRINLKSKEEILEWLKEYQLRNQITLRKVDNDEENSMKNVYKKVYRCVQSAPSNNGRLSVECDATIKTTLKNVNIKNSNDKLLKTHPCEIYINHSHNHILSISNSLHFEHWFKLLFEEGHSPTSALINIKEELARQYGHDYLDIVPTGKICLRESWVNNFYLTLYKEPFEEFAQEESSELEILINEYNDKCGDVCAVVNDQLTIAICSPFMKRNWVLIKEVGEIIYVDCSRLEKQNMKIMLFLCPSRLGILPLGMLLFPREGKDEEFISEGIKLLKIILPENAKTPKLMIVATTNEQECNLLKNSLNIDKVLICKNYVQKAALKWLWSHKNRLTKAVRLNIYVTFIKTLNCSKENAFEASYDNLLRLSSGPKDQKVFKYFENLKTTAPLWAMCYRQNQIHDTNDYSKIIYNVLEKNIPAKSLNILQLFAYVASKFENYFFNRLTKIMNCDFPKSENTETWQGCSSSVFDCREVGDNLYSVIEEGTKINIVNCSIDYCTCSVNQNIPCQHKWAVIRAYNFDDNDYPLANDKLKQLIKRILVDDECILKGWFDYNEKLDELNLDENTGKILTVVAPNMKEIRHKLETAMETIMAKLILNPSQFAKPVEKFISDFEDFKTDAALVNALETFGKPKITASPIGMFIKTEPNETDAGVKQKPVKIKAEKQLAPVCNGQNSCGNLESVELTYSNLVTENNLNDSNNGFSVKKRKLSNN